MSHRSKQFRPFVALLSSLMLVAGISGCSRTDSASELLTQAKQYQQKGDVKAALIQLRNAAAKEPENASVRRELGMLAYETGDLASADKELRKALSLGAPKQELLPVLAKIRLARGEVKELLDELPADAVQQSATLLVYRAEALAASGNRTEAEAALDQALQQEPKNGDVLLAKSRIAASKGDKEGFVRYIEEAIAADPGNVNVWLAKGMILRADNKPTEAIAAYTKALEVKPRDMEASIQRAFLYIDSRKFDEAKEDIARARSINPRNLMLNYLQAYSNFSQGKVQEARDGILQVLKAAPGHGPSLLLSGAIALRLNQFNQAELDLRKFLETNPNHLYARKLLAQALLNTAQPKDAVAALDPALKLAPQDAQLLALTGQSYLQTREFDKAVNYLEKAAVAAPEAAAVRTSLGIAQLGKGDVDKGLNELKRATTLDPKAMDAAFALIQAELQRKNYSSALAEVSKLEDADPKNAKVLNVKGHVQMAAGDKGAARATFDKALQLQPNYYPAIASLAFLDLRDKQPEAAKKRFTALLSREKNNVEAMTALAELARLENKPAEAITWLEKAKDVDQNAVIPSLRLGAEYLRQQQADKALTLLRKLAIVHPANPEVLDLFGQAQLASKDSNGALETYSKLVNIVPKSAAAQLRLAGVHMALKNTGAAAADVKRAIELDPTLLPARTAAVELAVNAKRFDEAIKLARDAQRDFPKLPLGHALEGDVYMFQRQGAAAQSAYRKAAAITDTPELAIKSYQAGRLAGDPEALSRLSAWQKAHPQAQTVGHQLSGEYFQNKNYKAAAIVLEGMVKQLPKDVVALNNLAYAYSQIKDARALPTAEQAAKLAGNSAAVLDTLGWILVEQGDAQRGVSILKKAVSAAPDAPEIAYHLAVALLKTGDRTAARTELDKLLARGQSFASLEAARALRKTL